MSLIIWKRAKLSTGISLKLRSFISRLSELLLGATPSIVPQYSLRTTPGFSADHAQTHMYSNSQVYLHMRAHTHTHIQHVVTHTHTEARFPTCVRTIGESKETTDSWGKVLMVSNILLEFSKAQTSKLKITKTFLSSATKFKYTDLLLFLVVCSVLVEGIFCLLSSALVWTKYVEAAFRNSATQTHNQLPKYQMCPNLVS